MNASMAAHSLRRYKTCKDSRPISAINFFFSMLYLMRCARPIVNKYLHGIDPRLDVTTAIENRDCRTAAYLDQNNKLTPLSLFTSPQAKKLFGKQNEKDQNMMEALAHQVKQDTELLDELKKIIESNLLDFDKILNHLNTSLALFEFKEESCVKTINASLRINRDDFIKHAVQYWADNAPAQQHRLSNGGDRE